MTKTHTTSNDDDGVCDNCFPCSVFRKTHRVSLSPTASAHSVQIPISCGNSVTNPPPAASQTPAPPPKENGTVVKNTEKSKPAAEIAAGIKKNDIADDDADEGFSGYIDRAKAKIRASSTFKTGEKKEGIIMPKTKTNRLDTLNYKVTNYINRTKLNIRRAPSTPN